MPFKKCLSTGLMLVSIMAALVNAAEHSDRSTPYDLIRPVWPLTWDSTVFDRYDTTVTTKHNMVPKNRTPAAFAPNQFVPDTLNQAYLDAMNIRMSPIRINQAGYLKKDSEKRFYYVGIASNFEVVHADGSSFNPAITGTFAPSGTEISSNWTIIAGTNAATNDQKRYQVDITGQTGIVQIGRLGDLSLPDETRLRIKVGNDFSSTFIVSDRVYSMVKNASLKFYGINRSGNGESWFHPASHTLDGAGEIVDEPEGGSLTFLDMSQAGTLEGGYYDCGDHLKESQTQMYAFMVAAVMAAANPDADEDVYAYNQSETANTDGIPDMLREAKHGADFVLRSYKRAEGVIDDMVLSIGSFGKDHGWWGRPENQDKLPTDGSAAATGRGGPTTRTLRQGEIGSNIGGETAAGLAILSKNYREFDPAFADSCLMVAEKMYDFAKSLAQGKSSYDGGKPFVHNTEAAGWSTPAYNGNNEFYDDMALASVALLYATGKKEYADDMIRTRNLVAGQEYMENCAGCFEGGWFVTNDKGFLKNGKNTSWANAYAYATYALYKLILQDKNKALTEYGLTEDEWLHAIEDCIMSMIYNLGDVSAGSATIELPSSPDWKGIGWKQTTVKYDPLWFSMFTDGTWIYNRYQAGNIFEVLAYADVAKDITDKGIVLPDMGAPDWKADEMHQLAINQLNYLLGMNPWDVSYILGIGDKNDAHPHHRAANPEGKNTPGAGYKYNPPVGALYGGVRPDVPKNVIVPSNKSWEDYFLSETCIDAAATLVSSGAVAAAKFDRTAAPNVSVEIRHVSADSAIVMVKLSTRGTATIFYGTSETDMKATVTDTDSTGAAKVGVQHEIVIGATPDHIERGTTYYFYVVGQNAYNPENMTSKFMVDSTQTPYSFTTLNMVESAEIANVTVCNLQGDSAEIMWYTPNGEYESKIYWDTIPHANASEYAFNSGAGNADVAGLPTKFHYVKIGGLKEKTTYYYVVESNGVQRNVDEDGDRLMFTTPVGWYDFSVRTYQYEADGGLDFLNVNVYNNEGRAFDSLTLRFYVTAKPEEIEVIPATASDKEGSCPLMIDSDICQAYDEAGFNKPCENDRELRDNLRGAPPVRLEDTYNQATGTYDYYIPVNLGSTVIKSSSRLRFDLGFSRGIHHFGKGCDPLRSPAAKRFTHPDTMDWSWKAHKFLEDGADFDGIPLESKDYGDVDNEVPENKFIAVYRKDEFIWGYSPSFSEMSTKRAHYKIETTLDAPFNVSNGSYIQIDQTSSTVYVPGHAFISEQGYITKIWANGKEIKSTTQRVGDEIFMIDENKVIIAHYNISRGTGPVDSTGLWTLNIPVKMSIGSNKIDITIFAGPDPECGPCTENGGCAFENRNYYVQFTRGELTASALTIKDEAGNPITSPAEPGNTRFYIYLTDKDKAKYTGNPITVLVINDKKQDTLKVTMTEDKQNPGTFKSDFAISAVPVVKNARTGAQISFFPGDVIQVIYEDPDDEEDVSKQSFFAESKYPEARGALALDDGCDNITDRLYIEFTNTLTADFIIDSVRAFIEGMQDTVTLTIPADSTLEKDHIFLNLPANLELAPNAAPRGTAIVYMTAEGSPTSTKINIEDGIAPQLLSVTILENPNHESAQDTLMIGFTEPVFLTSKTAWPLEVTADTVLPISVVGEASSSNGDKSWKFVVIGNEGGLYLKEGNYVSIKAGAVNDKSFNAHEAKASCQQIKIIETPKPVPITLAEMRDATGDGIPDTLFMQFEKKLRDKDMLDSFVVEWGSPSITKSFKPTSWTHTITETRWEEDIVDVDSLSPTYGQVIGKTPMKDTVSIIKVAVNGEDAYPRGSTSGDYDGTGRVMPKLGPEGGFFNRVEVVNDKCPPIIMSATWKGFDVGNDDLGTQDEITLTLSEPVDTVASQPYIVERTRNGKDHIYFSPLYNQNHSMIYNPKVNYIRLNYMHKIDDAIWIGDSLHLIASVESMIKDKAGLYPGAGNPWVPVIGSVTNIKFAITAVNPVTNSKSPDTTYYAGVPLRANENFRLTTQNLLGETVVLASGDNVLKKENVDNPGPFKNYVSAGPVFKIEISLPKADTNIYDLKIDLDIFNNMGSYVINTRYTGSTIDLQEYIIAGSTLTLYLEWCSPEEAPYSANKRKIGTGPYIAKFGVEASSNAIYGAAGEPEATENGESDSDTFTKTFGFRRIKR